MICDAFFIMVAARFARSRKTPAPGIGGGACPRAGTLLFDQRSCVYLTD